MKHRRHKKSYIKKPSKEELELPKFNKWLKTQGIEPITLAQYNTYLHGGGLPCKKNKFTKPINKIPSYIIPADRDPNRFMSVQTTDAISGKKDDSYKLEISKQYPVAIAYNKGGYMVLRQEEIRDAGKK